MGSTRAGNDGLGSEDTVEHDVELYAGPIWTITFGPAAKTYLVHEGVLKQCPVLGAMCNSGFLEATTKRIDLPEEEASDFHHMISYLYRGDIDPLKGTKQSANKSVDEAVEELTRTYVLADKYLSDGLKKRVVEELGKLCNWKQQRCEFVDIAKIFYQFISPTDDVFRQFFRKTMTSLLPYSSPNDWQYFTDVVGEGGLLAKEMYSQTFVSRMPYVETSHEGMDLASMTRFYREQGLMTDLFATI